MRRVTRIATLVVGMGVVWSVAPRPVRAASKEMVILQSDVDELQRQVYELKKLVESQNSDLQKLVSGLGGSDQKRELAAFNANVDSLRGEIHALATRFDDTTARLGAIERQLQDLHGAGAATDGAGAGAGPAASAPDAAGDVDDEHGLPPGGPDHTGAAAAPRDASSALFQQAYADYLKDSFELAVAEFKDYIQKYPTSDLADNAQYWIVMSAFNQKKYDDTIREADQLLGIYPKSEQASTTLYRKGLALTKLNRLGQAVLVFNDVIARYPGSPAATQASERLKELASGE